MNANTETTEGSAKPPADRSACKAWCGKNAEAVPAGERAGAWVQGIWADQEHWCSRACADTRLPPVAAPAHVRRRKGQPKVGDRFEDSQYRRTKWFVRTVSAVSDVGFTMSDGGNFAFDAVNDHLTLITDAPADPSGAGEAGAALPRSRELPCSDGCGTRAEILNQFVGWSCSACTKRRIEVAQEAPKAAPVCSFAPPHGNLHGGNVLKRVFAVRNDDSKEVSTRFACDSCYTFEEEVTFGLGGPSVLNDSRHPERLPRPALARDEMIEGDCWPDGGR